MKKDDEITKDKMLTYINAMIKTTQDHIEWYKKFTPTKSYITEELNIQQAIKKVIEAS